jgi:hypothetical protein
MIIKFCVQCKYHENKETDQGSMSLCRKENCYSQFSKCISTKALKWYLEDGTSTSKQSFSALDHVYSRE